METFRDTCKEHNLKITPQRLVIYEELIKSEDHPSADVIYRKVRKIFPNISFDTVYRTLLTYAQIGLVSVVEGYGDPKRFDPFLDKHHHLRCIKCNAIIDIYSKYYDQIRVPDEVSQQFTVLNHKVVMEGICSNCKDKK